MRHCIFLDNKIADSDFEQWRIEDASFWKTNIGVVPTYEVIRADFTTYPVAPDLDDDLRPTADYMKALTKQVESTYGPYGCDFIIMFVHQDNWRSSDPAKGKGLWGINFSYVYGSQCFDYCRWDKKNPANTFGTAYHERHHSLDAICKVELGLDVLPLLNAVNYDQGITHGKEAPWKYIRHKENLDSLKVLAPHLREAFAKRLQRHQNRLTAKKTIISLLGQIAHLLRMKMNKKDGLVY